jgi:hypothetical protein
MWTNFKFEQNRIRTKIGKQVHPHESPNNRTARSVFFFLQIYSPPSLDVMVDDLAGDEDGAAGRSVVGGDEERTSPEPGMPRLAVTLPAEVKKGT